MITSNNYYQFIIIPGVTRFSRRRRRSATAHSSGTRRCTQAPACSSTAPPVTRHSSVTPSTMPQYCATEALGGPLNTSQYNSVPACSSTLPRRSQYCTTYWSFHCVAVLCRRGTRSSVDHVVSPWPARLHFHAGHSIVPRAGPSTVSEYCAAEVPAAPSTTSQWSVLCQRGTWWSFHCISLPLATRPVAPYYVTYWSFHCVAVLCRRGTCSSVDHVSMVSTVPQRYVVVFSLYLSTSPVAQYCTTCWSFHCVAVLCRRGTCSSFDHVVSPWPAHLHVRQQPSCQRERLSVRRQCGRLRQHRGAVRLRQLIQTSRRRGRSPLLALTIAILTNNVFAHVDERKLAK